MNSVSELPVFVVLEGLDGAGKSTCARHLARILDARLMTTPSPEMRTLRTQILASYGTSQEAAQLFYMSTVFAAADEVGATLAAGRSVVMDRYFLSTQAYAAFRKSRLELDALAHMLIPAHLTVYLDAPAEVRAERLKSRGCSEDDRVTLTPVAHERLRQLHRQKAELPVVGRWMEIDNSSQDPQAVLEQILDAIRVMAGTTA